MIYLNWRLFLKIVLWIFLVIIIVVLSITGFNTLGNKSGRIIELENQIRKNEFTIDSLIDISYNQIDIVSKYEDQIKKLKTALISSIRNQDSTYLILGLEEGRDKNSNFVYAWPLAIVKDTLIMRPNRKYLKNVFDSTLSVFSVLHAGNNVGYLKNYSKYRWDGVKLEFISKPDSSILFQYYSAGYHYFSIATSKEFYSNTIPKKRVATTTELKTAKKIGKKILESQNVKVADIVDLKVLHVEVLKPSGLKDSLITGRFKYEVEFENLRKTHTTFFITEYNGNPDSLNYFESVIHRSDRDKGPGFRVFLDILDYDQDGVDEFIFVEHGYEHRDVVFLKFINGKFVKIYSVPTSAT